MDIINILSDESDLEHTPAFSSFNHQTEVIEYVNPTIAMFELQHQIRSA